MGKHLLIPFKLGIQVISFFARLLGIFWAISWIAATAATTFALIVTT